MQLQSQEQKQSPNLVDAEGKMIVASRAFSGPLPDPNDLAVYEQILPGAAERIFRMAEKEQDGRLETSRLDAKRKNEMLELEKEIAKGNLNAQTIGQYIGLGVVVVCVACAMICACIGIDWRICLGFLAIPTASFISAFIPSRNKQGKE